MHASVSILKNKFKDFSRTFTLKYSCKELSASMNNQGKQVYQHAVAATI